MPQNTTVCLLHLDDNSFTGEGIHILAGFMHLCPCVEWLSIKDCGITSDDLVWFLDKLTQFKSSSPSLCCKLSTWELNGNRIGDSGAHALMDHLPSLFPYLGCGIFRYNGIDLDNNLVSDEMKKRLEEELRERREVSYSVTYYCTIIC